MNTEISDMFMAKTFAQQLAESAVEVHATFGSDDIWQRCTLAAPMYRFDLGPHRWWKRLLVEDVQAIVAAMIASERVVVRV